MKKNDYYPLPMIVKPQAKIAGTIAVFGIILWAGSFMSAPISINGKAENYYQKEITAVQQKLTTLKKSCQKKSALNVLQQQFVSARISYKKLAVLSEYFNIYETKFLNGPALNRAEDDTPDIIIPPQGFQAIEEILFSNEQRVRYTDLNALVGKMLTTLGKMQAEPDRIYKFRDELVWDAIRSAVVRLASLGITGFDSPIAQNSLPEARASITGIKSVLLLFKDNMNATDVAATTRLIGLLDRAATYLEKHNNFNSFDRLTFISTYINPFYQQLLKARVSAGIAVPKGRSPVNFDAASIFQEDFFNINFFSPGQEYWKTNSRIALGKKLFSDPILSGTRKRSCASCHLPGKAFTDGLTVPYAMDNKTLLNRNTPTLWNSALQTRQFFDTRTDILENQLKEVVHNSDEMEGSLKESANELRKSPEYMQLFKAAYPEEKEPIGAYTVANAISSYIRSLISFNSRFDQYMRGDKSKLNIAEKNGFNLFAGKAKCATCHFIPLFNGLVPPEFTETETEVLGVPATNSKTSAVLDSDSGKYNISNSVIHKYAFKTPTLRNVELTGPYMHNGVFNTLEEVIDFYNNGGGAGLNIAPENQTLPKDKLNLSKKEIIEIISFLKALTDPAVKDYK